MSRSIASVALSRLIPAEKPRSEGPGETTCPIHCRRQLGLDTLCQVSMETLGPVSSSATSITGVRWAALDIPAGVLLCLSVLAGQLSTGMVGEGPGV